MSSSLSFPQQQKHVLNLIKGLLSTNNNIRNQAEQQFLSLLGVDGRVVVGVGNVVGGVVDGCILCLVSFCEGGGGEMGGEKEREVIQMMSSVLLRRYLPLCWEKMAIETHQKIQQKLLSLLSSSPPLPWPFAKKICDIIADVAIHILNLDDTWEQWVGLVTFLFVAICDDPVDTHRAGALYIASEIIRKHPMAFECNPEEEEGGEGEWVEKVIEMLLRRMNDDSYLVRLYTFSFAIYFFDLYCPPPPLFSPHPPPSLSSPSPSLASSFQNSPLFLVVVRMCDTLSSSLEFLFSAPSSSLPSSLPSFFSCFDFVREMMDLFVEMTETETYTWPLIRSDTLSLMISLFEMVGGEEGGGEGSAVGYLGMEVVVGLCECRPDLMNQMKDMFLENTITHLLCWNSHLEDNSDWNKGENYDCEDPDVAVAETSLDRISLALGEDTDSASLIFSLIFQFISSSVWRERHSGLMAIAIAAEGCSQHLHDHLPLLMKTVTPHLKDPNPRIRWAVANTMAQLSLDFSPNFQALFHSDIVTFLTFLMRDTQNPRVQSHAAAAMAGFWEGLGEGEGGEKGVREEEWVEVEGGKCLEGLFGLLGGGDLFVLIQVLTATSTIAQKMTKQFLPYYSLFAPHLKKFLDIFFPERRGGEEGGRGEERERKRVWGRSLECLTMMGGEVWGEGGEGREDVLFVVGVLERCSLGWEDEEFTFVTQAWVRLAKFFGEKFSPFLEKIVPSLLVSASKNPGIRLMGGRGEEGEREGEWTVWEGGEREIWVRTSAIEEKQTATKMIVSFCEFTGPAFFPFALPALQALLPSLIFYYDDSTRLSAAASLPLLLTCLKLKSTKDEMVQIWKELYPTFINSLKNEMVLDVHSMVVTSFRTCVTIMGEESHTNETLGETVFVLQSMLQKYLDRQLERTKQINQQHQQHQQQPSAPPSLSPSLLHQTSLENSLIQTITTIHSLLFSLYPAHYLPPFLPTLPLWASLLSLSSSPSHLLPTITLLSTTLTTAPHSLPHLLPFSPLLLPHLSSPHPPLSIAAIVGVTKFSEMAGEEFLKLNIARNVSDILCDIIRQRNSAQNSNNDYLVVENAIAGVGKLCLYQARGIDFERCLSLFVSVLPVLSQSPLSQTTHQTFLSLLSHHLPLIVGPKRERFSHLLGILGILLGSNLVTEEGNCQIQKFLKNFVDPRFSDSFKRENTLFAVENLSHPVAREKLMSFYKQLLQI